MEEVADVIDMKDNEIGDFNEDLTMDKNHRRPYLVSKGMENGIKYIFTMLLFMSQIASQADFIQRDITYDSSKEYHIFNAVAFDNSSMEWIAVVAFD